MLHPAASPARSLPSLHPRTADVDGPVHYVDSAPGGRGGPTLVLVHGLGGCHLNWLPAAPLLAEGARVVALDLVGFGRTPRAGRGVGPLAQQRVLGRFLRAVVGGPAVLVGNSFGGLVALAQAALEPQSVAALALVSPAQPPPPGLLPEPFQLLRLLLHAVPGLGEWTLWRDGRHGARKQFLDLLALGCADVSRVPADVVDANVALVAERMARAPWGHAAGYLQASRALLWHLARPARFHAWVRAVAAPTLLVHGREDRLVPLAFSEHLAAQRPDWTFLRLAGVGHVPQMEAGAAWAAALQAWLARELAPPLAAAS